MNGNNISKKGNTLLGYIFLGLCIYLCFQIKSCINDSKKQQNTNKNGSEQKLLSSDTSTKYIYSDRWHTITKTGKTIIIHDSVEVPVLFPIDTLAVLKSFFRENIYIDTLADSNITAIIRFRIAQNMLMEHPEFSYKINVPQVEKTITNVVEQQPKGYFLIGIQAGANKSLYATFAPTLLFVSKRKKIYGIGYDAIHKSINASFYYPLVR